MTSPDAFDQSVTRLGALADPIRRALYRFVVAQREPVGRDQAAAGVDVPRHTAKHHLDRLVEEGLLDTDYRRLTGRTGPGAGRPAKLYRRAGGEVAVSVPERRYDLAGRVLADAVTRALDGTPMPDAVDAAARTAGAEAATSSGVDAAGDDLERVARALTPFGYEPWIEEDLRLANCPFDRLAAEHTTLVCGMNVAFVEELAAGLGCSGARTVLDPGPDRCCVRVERG